jgi:hypothetical protein
MEREANGLIAEAKRLRDEASSLNPTVSKKPAKAKKVKHVA